MIERRKDDLMPDQTMISDIDPALVLKAAAGIDENIFPEKKILSKIGINRGKQAKALPRLIAGQFGHQGAQLFGSMKAAIDLRRDALRLGGSPAHPFLQFFRVEEIPARSDLSVRFNIQNIDSLDAVFYTTLLYAKAPPPAKYSFGIPDDSRPL